MKDIGEKDVVLSGSRIPIAITPKLDGAIICLGAGQQDGMVRGQVFDIDHPASLQDPILGSLFQTSDEEDLFLRELKRPVKIQASSVQHYNREGRKSQKFGHRDIIHFCGLNPDKCGDIAVVIQ